MGKRLSQICNRASSGRVIALSLVTAPRGGRGERERRARKGNALLLQELCDASDIGADDSRFRDHQWLMPVADVVGVESPLLGRARLDQEHRLRPLDDKDDGLQLVEDQTVAAAQHRAARKGKTERESAVGPSASAYTQSVFPSARDRVAGIAAGDGRQRVVGLGQLGDYHTRK